MLNWSEAEGRVQAHLVDQESAIFPSRGPERPGWGLKRDVAASATSPYHFTVASPAAETSAAWQCYVGRTSPHPAKAHSA